jgi:lysozyme
MVTDIKAMLIAQEGPGPMKDGRFFPYVDTVGKRTIGFGHNLDDKGMPADVAMMLLHTDIADALDDVRHCCSCYDTLTRPRQLVMVSLAFNLGRERLNKFVRFLGAVHRVDWDEAADELLDSKAATQAPARYGQLAKMMRENVSLWV